MGSKTLAISSIGFSSFAVLPKTLMYEGEDYINLSGSKLRVSLREMLSILGRSLLALVQIPVFLCRIRGLCLCRFTALPYSARTSDRQT